MEVAHYQIAVLVVRVLLGILFLMQGYDKVVKVGLSNVIQTFKSQLGPSRFPDFIVVLAAYYTSYIELIGGFFLIVGFLKYYTLYLLGIDFILVTVAMGSIEPLWKMDYVFPRLVLFLILLLVPVYWDCLSVDQYLHLY